MNENLMPATDLKILHYRLKTDGVMAIPAQEMSHYILLGSQIKKRQIFCFHNLIKSSMNHKMCFKGICE